MNNKPNQSLPLHLQKNLKDDPYKLLDDFFGVSSLNGWRNWLQTCFTAAFEESFTLKEVPGNFLYSADHLQLCICACSLLLTAPKQTQQKRTKAVALTALKYQRDVCIKHVSMYETMHPTSVLQNFFAYQNLEDWMQTLQLWKEAALGKTSITELEEVSKLMPQMELLYKLIEAAWLICVAKYHPAGIHTGAVKSF